MNAKQVKKLLEQTTSLKRKQDKRELPTGLGVLLGELGQLHPPRQNPNPSVEVKHNSDSFCHLGNITRELAWDPDQDLFRRDEVANELRTHSRRNGYELPIRLLRYTTMQFRPSSDEWEIRRCEYTGEPRSSHLQPSLLQPRNPGR